MAVGTKWTILALALALGAGCGDDSGGGGGDGDGDGQSDGTPDDGSGDGQISIDGDEGDGGDGSDEPILGDATAGKACADNAACAPSGTCAATLTAGAIGTVFDVSVEAEGGYCTAACQNDAQCGEGGVCFGDVPAAAAQFLGITSTDGECRQACTANTDCREGYECAAANPSILDQTMGFITLENTCQPAPVTDQLTDGVGGACTAAADCGAGTCVSEQGGVTYPGGYCSGTCTEDSQCGTDGVCLPGLYGTGGTCAETCETDADCARDADGYGCRDQGDKKACIPAPDPLPEGALGAACTEAGGECGTGTCAATLPGPISGIMLPEQVDAPGGYCTVACQTAVDCGEGGACVIAGGDFATLRIDRVCFDVCEADTDCRDGYRCADRNDLLGGGTSRICEPGEREPTEPEPDAGT